MRVVISGLLLNGSGLTLVMSQLAKGISDIADVSLLGFAPDSDEVFEKKLSGFDLTIEKCKIMRFYMPVSHLEDLILNQQIDAVIVIGPPLLVEPFLAQLSRLPNRKKLHIILYLAIEGTPTSPAILDVITLADDCIVYTPSCLKSLEKIILKEKEKRENYKIPRLSFTGHGVDISAFHPIEEIKNISIRKKIRQQFWECNDENEIAILNVSKPYERKRLDLTIKGFALCTLKIPNIRLVLHLGKISNEQDAAIKLLIEESGIADKISIIDANIMSQEKLNLLYNVCDIGINSAMGEGWGLPVFEHAATGAPQIVPNHTSFKDNWHNAAVFLPITKDIPIFYEYGIMHETSAEHICSAILQLTEETQRVNFGKLALKRALQKKYSWSNMINHFKNILKSK